MKHWRVHLFWLVAISCIVLVGCGGDYVREQSTLVNDKAQEVKNITDELVQTVERFDDENWRETVPDVRRLVSELASKTDEMAAATQELEEAVTAEEEYDY